MKNVYLHNKKSNLINEILILLIPFFIYGFYKNYLTLYNSGYINLFGLGKGILFPLLGLVVSIFYSLLKKEKLFNYNLLLNLLITFSLPNSVNIPAFLILIIVVNIVLYFFNINSYALFMSIYLFIFFILGKLTFLNNLEIVKNFEYTFIDYFFGKGPGGIFNSFTCMSIIAFSFLCLNYEYKRSIPICTFLTYYLFIFIYSFIKAEMNLDLFVNNNLIFMVVFALPLSLYSPYSKGAMYIFGIISGILLFLVSFWQLDIGVYLVLLLMSLTYKLYDKIFTKN